MTHSTKPTVLVILDGFGYSPEKKYNAVAQATMPNFKKWLTTYPHALLKASGESVGLPKKYSGNSEVGHLTIGAGRVITQDLTRINTAISNGTFYTNPILVENFLTLQQHNHNLHLMGLLSDAGVHSHINHIFALLDMAKKYAIPATYLHLFLDGRDVPPQSAEKYLKQIEEYCTKITYGSIGSICGRFYAMDRNKNWERTKKCYDSLTQEQRQPFKTWQEALTFYYQSSFSDEFIPPLQLDLRSNIHNKDGIIFFNFRPDRARQLTEAFTNPLFNSFPTKKYDLSFFLTMTDYDQATMHTQSIFKKNVIAQTLKEVLNNAGKTIFSIAETEKYAHVTYFFTGMKEEKLPLETRMLIPSLHEKNYIHHPEMSAQKITQTVLDSLQKDPKDFYIINYANADMVGHSGDLRATITAIEYLDTQLKILYEEVVQKMNGTLYITADHGKAEDMYDEQAQQPQTAHTNNPVYFVMLNKESYNKPTTLNLHTLSDIAPFILGHMNLVIPKQMKKKL